MTHADYSVILAALAAAWNLTQVSCNINKVIKVVLGESPDIVSTQAMHTNAHYLHVPIFIFIIVVLKIRHCFLVDSITT